MPYDFHTTLWPNTGEAFFRTATFTVQRQVGPHCVFTVLAILTEQTPEQFQGRINTQNPVSWSEALAEYGMKLAYCPTDVRKLKHYLPELIALDDLFTSGRVGSSVLQCGEESSFSNFSCFKI
jgi:hypothetical protein